MKNYIKYISVVVIGIAIGLIVAKFLAPRVELTAGASAVGATFTTAKEAAITWTLSNGATTTSILNTDASDRYIKAAQAMCTGVGTSYTAVTGAGLASLTITAATTSAAAPASITNVNTFLTSQTLATSSASSYFSTSTPQLGGGSPFTDYTRIWASGSYITFASNATSTATCTIGVTYLGS